MTYLGIMKILLPFMSFAILGGAANRFNITRGKPEKWMLRLLINFFVPVMVVDYVVGSSALENMSKVVSAPVLGFYGIAAGCLASWYTARFFGITTRRSMAAFALTVGFYNYGFLSIPITEHLLGKETVGLLLVHNTGIDLAFWTLGVGLVSGFSGKNVLNILKTPPLIAIVLSLAFNFTFGGDAMPDYVHAVLHPFAVVAVPLGLFISGATLAESSAALLHGKAVRVSLGSVLLRMVIIPLIMVITAKYLPISNELKMITAVQAAMPAGMMSISIIKYFSGDVDTAAQAILSTTLVSLVTIPLAISLFASILS